MIVAASRSLARHGAVYCTASAPISVGVIGGGISGVTAARALAEAGVSVVVHERSAILGGRLGAVEFEGEFVSAACSYIKASDPSFRRQCERWEEDGVLCEWSNASPHVIAAPGEWAPLSSKDERWFVGAPDMGAPTALTTGTDSSIDVRHGDVFDVNFDAASQQWVVATQPATEDAADLDAEVPIESHLYSALVLAVPVHEAAELLDRKLLDALLGRRRYKDFVKERVSALFKFERSLELPFGFAAITMDDAPATVVISESSRRRSSSESEEDCEIWVVQSATSWAKSALDEEMGDAEMEASLLEAFAKAIGREVDELPPVVSQAASVWPYGDMDYEVEGGCVWKADMRLALAGDWAYNGRVQGAWLSGRAAAQRVLDAL